MSETTTQHPERRAGQRWRHEWDKLEFVLSKPLGLSTTGKEQWESTAGRIWYFGKGELTSLTLLSDVPAAAPLAAVCKAPEWCDFDDAPDSKDPRIQVYVKAKDGNYGVRRGHRIYCSETCAPPLAAQPAETAHGECCEPGCSVGCPAQSAPVSYFLPCGYRISAPSPAAAADAKSGHVANCAKGCNPMLTPTQIAPQPAPAKLPCPGCRKAICIGEYLSCREVALHHREPLGTMTLTESDVPERLERPKLAHSAMWADEAEDVS
jgi:hypothetical protein